MGKRNKVSPLERRLNGAKAQAELALNVFKQAADDLDAAAADAQGVIDDVLGEIAQLEVLLSQATATENSNRRSAEKIRDLLGA